MQFRIKKHPFIRFTKTINRIIEHRKSIIALLAVITLISLYSIIANLKIDNSLRVWFLNDDPNYINYLDYQEAQGSDEIIVIMLPRESSIYSKTFLDKLDDLHRSIDSLPFVAASFSLANAEYPILTTRGLQLKSFYSKRRDPPFAKKKLGQLPALNRILVSEDQLNAFFYVQLKPVRDIGDFRDVLVNEVTGKVGQLFDSYHLTGSPVLNQGTNESIAEESAYFSIATIAVILILLFFLLPQRKYLLLGIIAIGLPTIFLFGAMTALGFRLNMISMIIPTILMIYSLSDVLHIIYYYQNQKSETPKFSKNKLIATALEKSLKPCIFTTVTTMTGYLALYVSPLPALKITGLGAFSGLLLAFLLVYIICAIGFSYLPEPDVTTQKKGEKMLAFLRGINRFTDRYKRGIIAFSVLLFLFGIYSLTQIKVNTNLLNFIKEGQVKNDYRIIDEKLNGTLRFDLRISSTENEVLTKPATLKAISKFQDALFDRQILNNPFSIIDLGEYLKKNAASSLLLKPRILSKIQSLNDKNKSFFHLVSEDLTSMSIIGNTKIQGTAIITKQSAEMARVFAQTIPDSMALQMEIVGYSPLYVKMNEYILKSQLFSFGTAFLLSFFVLIFFVKNLRTSILSLLPNLLPLLLMIIVMVLLNIPIEASTAMIAPIMLGVAMDDTIHLIHKYKLFKKSGLSVDQSMDKAMLEVGKAVVSTSLTLIIGFCVIGLSSLMSIKIFGILCASTVFFAFFADVLLLAALMKMFDK